MLSPKQVLDEYFLDARCILLEIVATFTSGVEFVDTTRRNDLVSRGWCLAKPPKYYIVYLKDRAPENTEFWR